MVAQLVKNLPGFDPWVGKIPWGREGLLTPVFWPGEFHEQRSLACCGPWGCKESDTTERFSLFSLRCLSNALSSLKYFSYSTLLYRSDFPETGIETWVYVKDSSESKALACPIYLVMTKNSINTSHRSPSLFKFAISLIIFSLISLKTK